MVDTALALGWITVYAITYFLFIRKDEDGHARSNLGAVLILLNGLLGFMIDEYIGFMATIAGIVYLINEWGR